MSYKWLIASSHTSLGCFVLFSKIGNSLRGSKGVLEFPMASKWCETKTFFFWLCDQSTEVFGTLLETLSSKNRNRNRNSKTHKETGERTPLRREFIYIKQPWLKRCHASHYLWRKITTHNLHLLRIGGSLYCAKERKLLIFRHDSSIW